MARRSKIAVGLTVSVVSLLVACHAVRLPDLAQALRHADLRWLLPALVCFLMMFSVRAMRWAVLLGGTPFWTTLLALHVGYMMNCTLPLRAGEIGRAYVLCDRTGIRMARALSSVVVERVLDLASIVALFAVLVQVVPTPPRLARGASLAAACAIVAIAVGVWIVHKADEIERWARPLIERSGRRGDLAWERFREVVSALRDVGSARRLATVLTLTGIIWGLTVALAYFSMAAFMAPSALHAASVVVAANLGGALPSAPGGLGVVQGSATMALVLPFHVPPDRALAFVLVWTVGQQGLLVLLGVLALGRLGVSLRQARDGAFTP